MFKWVALEWSVNGDSRLAGTTEIETLWDCSVWDGGGTAPLFWFVVNVCITVLPYPRLFDQPVVGRHVSVGKIEACFDRNIVLVEYNEFE